MGWKIGDRKRGRFLGCLMDRSACDIATRQKDQFPSTCLRPARRGFAQAGNADCGILTSIHNLKPRIHSSGRSPSRCRPATHPTWCMARPVRLERTTCGFEVRRSIQLSYGRIGVSDGTRTLDHWGHNPVLYPTELHSPSNFSQISVTSHQFLIYLRFH